MGAGNPTISGETKTQVRAACQPWQPHNITLPTKIHIVKAMVFPDHKESDATEWLNNNKSYPTLGKRLEEVWEHVNAA